MKKPQRPRKPYHPPRVKSQRTFEQNTLACGKQSDDPLIHACGVHKTS